MRYDSDSAERRPKLPIWGIDIAGFHDRDGKVCRIWWEPVYRKDEKTEQLVLRQRDYDGELWLVEEFSSDGNGTRFLCCPVALTDKEYIYLEGSRWYRATDIISAEVVEEL